MRPWKGDNAVIPSRADDEGPHRRSEITQTKNRNVRKCSLRGSRTRFCVCFSATARSLAVSAARDDTLANHRPASHGCIRTANWDAVRVKDMVSVGNPVSILKRRAAPEIVRPGKGDNAVIPSRADDEGPHRRSEITQTKNRNVRKCSLRGIANAVLCVFLCDCEVPRRLRGSG